MIVYYKWKITIVIAHEDSDIRVLNSFITEKKNSCT